MNARRSCRRRFSFNPISSLTSALLRSRSKRTRRGRDGRMVGLSFEVLEDRNLLAFYSVNIFADELDVAHGGFDIDTGLSLRDAVFDANVNAGADDIVFDATVFTAGLPTIILSGTQLPTITETLAINGSIDSGTAWVSVDGAGASRVFENNSTLSISNLIVRNGAAAQGGGILNTATLTHWTAGDLAAALVDLGALTDDGDKDDLKGDKGLDELIGGIADKLKP